MKISQRPNQFLRNRRFRFYLAVAVGLIVFTTSRAAATFINSLMFGWLAFAFFNLLFSWIIICTFHPLQVKMYAKQEDTSSSFIFVFVLVAAIISLFAIIFLLQSVPHTSKQGLSLHIILSFSSVFCSWMLIHTQFTLRYAHLYYQGGKLESGGEGQAALCFPNEVEPDYLDFAYFSFVVGMTFQVSDVEISSRQIRRLALLHGFLSFIYNTVIVAFTINIVSGLIAR